MPRKVSYGVDYDEEYDDYEDYDVDYDLDVEDNGNVPQSKQETIKRGIWRCSICTYDNDESLSVCDICGVLRNPLINYGPGSDKKTVEGMCKDSGASKMAKFLFASLPRLIPKKAASFQKQNDVFLKEEGNSSHMHMNMQGQSLFFFISICKDNLMNSIKTFTTCGQHHFNIARFKFDAPSPDDLVFDGLRSSKKVSKGILLLLQI
ncbi:hypothetical protein F2P56_017605 [Juglans regia]|uniref:RanBP2-type domain-containing protein n=1 Tax=Juglans regia TaxID=51240 RepID=A0A833X6S2_JUGRE|nr:hypothetical protein F2P56_017605 [Juglans regia]